MSTSTLMNESYLSIHLQVSQIVAKMYFLRYFWLCPLVSLDVAFCFGSHITKCSMHIYDRGF